MRAAEISETLLYRGDASKIDAFDSAKAGFGLLYTYGTYLTNSPEVAGDYTLKGSEHVVFTDENAKDVRDLVMHYLGRLIVTKTDWKAATDALKQSYLEKGYEQSSGLRGDEYRAVYERLQKEWDRDVDKLRSKHLSKAKQIFKTEAASLRVVRATTGEWSLVKAGRDGHITTFDIPDAYLAKTLHTDRPMPPKVLAAMRELWFETYRAGASGGDPATAKFDMRSHDNEFQTFDDWVKAYSHGKGIRFAWRGKDDDLDPVVRGKGQLPDLETLWHGTHMGGSWFHDSANMAKFIKAMQDLGYVGLEYDGGKRVGSHVRGGGGILHRAFVFWDDAAINRFRIGSKQVSDTQGAAGHEKGARNTTRLRQIVGALSST